MGDNGVRSRFEALLQVKAPTSMLERIDQCAARGAMTRSAFVRHAILDRLKADGPEAVIPASVES